jgi:hypothetical protein
MNGHASDASRSPSIADGERPHRAVDNGRGIPVDIHPKDTKQPRARGHPLHGAARGRQVRRRQAYNDVGRPARRGRERGQRFLSRGARGARAGATASRARAAFAARRAHGLKRRRSDGPARAQRGTSVHFRPDTTIFGESAAFDPTRIRERLEAKPAYLHGGLALVLARRGHGADRRAVAPRWRHRRLPAQAGRAARQGSRARPALRAHPRDRGQRGDAAHRAARCSGPRPPTS